MHFLTGGKLDILDKSLLHNSSIHEQVAFVYNKGHLVEVDWWMDRWIVQSKQKLLQC